MQEHDERQVELIELGSVTSDTHGPGGHIIEVTILMPRAGISPE